MDLCKFLRWKGRTSAQRVDAELLAVFEANAVPYSCLRTCHPWGPDDHRDAP
jgi:hypothetical protein